MDSAISLSTEISVLRAVARVSSGTLNKEAPAFCRSHPHNLLIRLKIWNVCDQCHSGMDCTLQISSNLDSFTEFLGLNLSRHHQPM
jgi:hypothetical protein